MLGPLPTLAVRARLPWPADDAGAALERAHDARRHAPAMDGRHELIAVWPEQDVDALAAEAQLSRQFSNGHCHSSGHTARASRSAGNARTHSGRFTVIMI